MLLINHDTRRHSNEPIYLDGDACREWQSGGKTRVSKSRDLFGVFSWLAGKKAQNPLANHKAEQFKYKAVTKQPPGYLREALPQNTTERIDYFNEGKNYVVYKSINNIMGVAGNRIRHEHITSQTTVSGI